MDVVFKYFVPVFQIQIRRIRIRRIRIRRIRIRRIHKSFGPPGSLIICTDPDSDSTSKIKQNSFGKPQVISSFLWNRNILLSLKTNVNVPSVSKIIRKNIYFCWKTKKRTEPGYPLVRSANPGSVSKRHYSNCKLLPVAMVNVDLNLFYLRSILWILDLLFLFDSCREHDPVHVQRGQEHRDGHQGVGPALRALPPGRSGPVTEIVVSEKISWGLSFFCSWKLRYLTSSIPCCTNRYQCSGSVPKCHGSGHR